MLWPLELLRPWAPGDYQAAVPARPTFCTRDVAPADCQWPRYATCKPLLSCLFRVTAGNFFLLRENKQPFACTLSVCGIPYAPFQLGKRGLNNNRSGPSHGRARGSGGPSVAPPGSESTASC